MVTCRPPSVVLVDIIVVEDCKILDGSWKATVDSKAELVIGTLEFWITECLVTGVLALSADVVLVGEMQESLLQIWKPELSVPIATWDDLKVLFGAMSGCDKVGNRVIIEPIWADTSGSFHHGVIAHFPGAEASISDEDDGTVSFCTNFGKTVIQEASWEEMLAFLHHDSSMQASPAVVVVAVFDAEQSTTVEHTVEHDSMLISDSVTAEHKLTHSDTVLSSVQEVDELEGDSSDTGLVVICAGLFSLEVFAAL